MRTLGSVTEVSRTERYNCIHQTATVQHVFSLTVLTIWDVATSSLSSLVLSPTVLQEGAL